MTENPLADLRKEYGDRGLDELAAGLDPWRLWQEWFDDAVASGLHEPNAMVVATVSADGRPSARTVLLKGASADGFRFFTNTSSHKGSDLSSQPHCALLFPWHPVERQVRVEGVAEQLPQSDVDAYFRSRPRQSQLGAWASQQSRVVADRAELDAAYAEAERRYAGGSVPVPPYWGGYLVRPQRYEFWQGRSGRLHDRLAYRLEATSWVRERLAP